MALHTRCTTPTIYHVCRAISIMFLNSKYNNYDIIGLQEEKTTDYPTKLVLLALLGR